MRERLAPQANAAETIVGLSDSAVVNAVAVGNDAQSGDALLWIETAESGPFSFQLSPQALDMFCDALRDYKDRSREDNGAAASVLRYG